MDEKWRETWSKTGEKSCLFPPIFHFVKSSTLQIINCSGMLKNFITYCWPINLSFSKRINQKYFLVGPNYTFFWPTRTFFQKNEKNAIFWTLFQKSPKPTVLVPPPSPKQNSGRRFFWYIERKESATTLKDFWNPNDSAETCLHRCKMMRGTRKKMKKFSKLALHV